MNLVNHDLKYKSLFKHWGFNKFRDAQEEIIDQVLEKKDVLALLPTGGGKSLCFQLPAVMQKGTCIVISPLIALMEDQVNQLLSKGISATYLNSNHHYKDIDRILDNVIFGKIKILYISPERITTKIFKERFKKMNISFIAVDEAHCISEWGNDFRPDFKNIHFLRNWMPNISFIALTATATKEVVEDIQSQLLFRKNNVVSRSFSRKNIVYNVIDCFNKEEVLLKVLKKECSIIYVRTRNKTQYLSKLLNNKNYSADFYHGGLTFKERTKKQELWINNKFDIMVATNAFGMGIDKPNVRNVIHYEMSETIESFYQESGRAGRDGKTSFSTILKDEMDIEKIIKRHKINFPTSKQIKSVFQAISNIHQIPMGYFSEDSYEIDVDIIALKSKLSRSLTLSCLKYLKIEQYLKELNEYQFSKIRIVVSIKYLNSFLNNYPKYEKIIDVLIRSYSNIDRQLVAVSEVIISNRLNKDTDEIIRQLEQLHNLKIINYYKKKSSNKIQFLRPRPNINQLKLSRTYLNSKKVKEEKNSSLIHFLNSKNKCRNLALLNYFGEKTDKNCNQCDYCNMALSKKLNPDNFVENAILSLLTYEPKPPSYLYNQLQEILKKDNFNNSLRMLIKNEIISIKKNLLHKN